MTTYIQFILLSLLKYIFASFITRDYAYDLLTDLLQQHCNNDVGSQRTRSASTISLASTIANSDKQEHFVQDVINCKKTLLCSSCFVSSSGVTNDQYFYIGMDEILNQSSITDTYQLLFEQNILQRVLSDRFEGKCIQ